VHKEIPDDGDLKAAWRNLLQTVDQPQVFYTFEWALSATRAYPNNCPILFAAYEQDELVGVVALSADYPNRQASFLTAATADYCDFLCVEKHRREFIEKVLDHIEFLSLRTLVLANLPADSSTATVLRRVTQSRGFSALTRHAYHCAQLRFESPAERETMKHAATRKEAVRRHLKALSKLGPVTVEHLCSRVEIEQALPEFAHMHVSRFLATGRISNLASSERRMFLGELTQQLSNQRAVVLSRLVVQDRPIAWNFGFRFDKSWFWYQPTFDTEFQQYSPGLCLLAKIIEDASQRSDLRLVDLGLGAEEYKDRWSNQGRETLHVIVSRSPGVYCREALRYHAGQTIRRSPVAERWVRSSISRLARLNKRDQNFSALARFAKRKLITLLRGEPEVLFFENPVVQSSSETRLHICPATFNLLAQAVTRYRHDSETLSYLLRAAERVRSRQTHGFVAVDEAGIPVHFCWVTPFDNFYMSEIDREMTGPSPKSQLIFDCWTPAAVRGNGYYPATIRQIAEDLSRSGPVWIFASATSESSLRGIKKAGFVARFSVALRRSGLRKSTVYSTLTPGSMMQASSAA
jgi:CelD/BcsL family acetyltransferase involved in cellulose biosynthesis